MKRNIQNCYIPNETASQASEFITGEGKAIPLHALRVPGG
jgi:hypothetical protein